MPVINIKGLKGSDVLCIKMTILKILEESSGFVTNYDPDLTEKGDNLVISFRQRFIKGADIQKIIGSLGQSFELQLSALNKEEMNITLTAPRIEFMNLVGIEPELELVSEQPVEDKNKKGKNDKA